MNSQNKVFGLLTICRKAGMLIAGFDPVKESVISGKAKCVFTASDISPKTMKEVYYYCKKYNVAVVKTEFNMEEYMQIFRRKTAVLSVIDKGFASRLIELFNENKDNKLPNLQ